MRRADTVWTVLAALALFSCAAWAQPAVTPAVAEEAPAPVATTPAPEAVKIVAGEKKGLDTLVSISLREMDLSQAVRLLAEGTGMNLAVGKEVEGKVTCNLTNVTARTALDTLVRVNGCTYTEADGVIIVLKQAPATGGGSPGAALPVVRKPVRAVLQLPYSGMETDSTIVGETGGSYSGGGGAAKVGVSIEDTIRNMLSPLGRMAYYARQQMVIVEDDEATVGMIQQFVAELWKVPPQVYIESSLLEVSLEEGETLGFHWSTSNKVSGAGKINQATGAAGDFNGTMVTSGGPGTGLDKFFSFGIVNSNISVVLEMLATRQRVDLRSNPRILVMNHRTASVAVGQEIPYLSSIESTAANPIRTYDFKEVVARLDVTPHIASDGMIFMDVHPSIKSVIGYTVDPRQPILSTREAATNVSVADGSTLIIGGLVQRNISKQFEEVPFISHIPLIGWFFQHKAVDDTKNDLLFLLSPKIVSAEVMQNMLEENRGIIVSPPPHAGESPASAPKW